MVASPMGMPCPNTQSVSLVMRLKQAATMLSSFLSASRHKKCREKNSLEIRKKKWSQDEPT
jgi:hypothetical protein